ncbi:xin actin-binding repeat-containing protein 1 [Platysternon megacephalum]|uniref:Xin actin-binding repeat-containing protein 1 n=1 Tax=Platysternon megacephalum TaxID=55544 RepID=A0A4D9EB38_9SAUR|nr:xin actin-binding repeat-containing protein 1 [Platysternon megacephalum]
MDDDGNGVAKHVSLLDTGRMGTHLPTPSNQWMKSHQWRNNMLITKQINKYSEISISSLNGRIPNKDRTYSDSVPHNIMHILEHLPKKSRSNISKSYTHINLHILLIGNLK